MNQSAKIITPKLGLLELAKQLGNVLSRKLLSLQKTP